MEDFFKVLPSHMKVVPDHYKGPLATSKGHAPLLIPVAAMGKCKQANEFQLCHYGHLTSLIIHEHNRPNSRFKVVARYPEFSRSTNLESKLIEFFVLVKF